MAPRWKWVPTTFTPHRPPLNICNWALPFAIFVKSTGYMTHISSEALVSVLAAVVNAGIWPRAPLHCEPLTHFYPLLLSLSRSAFARCFTVKVHPTFWPTSPTSAGHFRWQIIVECSVIILGDEGSHSFVHWSRERLGTGDNRLGVEWGPPKNKSRTGCDKCLTRGVWTAISTLISLHVYANVSHSDNAHPLILQQIKAASESFSRLAGVLWEG